MAPRIHETETGRLGAEITGLDLSGPLDAGETAFLKKAFAEHPLLVFPDQDLDAGDVARIGKSLGPLERHVLRKYRHPDHPDISYLTNVGKDGSVDRDGVRRATAWHSDGTFTGDPPTAAILYALETPSTGGGTLFTDMSAAHDELDPEDRERLEGLDALHRYGAGPGGSRSVALDADQVDRYPTVRHPAVGLHPKSGRRHLYVNDIHTYGFEGMDDEEGLELVKRLTAHATQDRFVHHHAWRPGTMILWDERCTMHRSAGDYDPNERRVMLRTIIGSGADL